MAASTALLRYWFLLVLPLLLIMGTCLSRWARNDNILRPKNSLPAVTLKKLVTHKKNMNHFFGLTSGLNFPHILIFTVLTITANLHPDASVPSLKFSDSGIVNIYSLKFSDTVIVQNIYLLNYIYITVMISGAINVVLIYIQIVMPCNDHVKKLKETTEDRVKYEEKSDDNEESQEGAAVAMEDLARERTAS